VTIFRLITKGTIEEKIYQRQIYKLLLTNRILDNPHQKRLFSKSEISELFELGSDHVANDLPYDGEIDMEVDSSHTTNVHQEDTSNNETGFDIDKKLLKALFDGDAVTNVYDHGYFENNGDSSNSSAKMSQIQELAKKSVDEAVKQLKLSVQSRQSNNNTEDTTKKVYVPNSMAPPSASASTMLTGLRKLNQKNNNSQSSNQATDTDGNNNVNILSRLHKLFQRSRKLQTADIVKSFEDLPDSFAPVFREMLRRIAVFKDGYWEYIGEVEV
jgi:DNA excision repair protein ERCC-6